MIRFIGSTICVVLVSVIAGCTEDVFVGVESSDERIEQEEMNSVALDFDNLVTVEDHVDLIISHSSSLSSNPSTCQILDPDELSDELDIATRELDEARESGDIERINLSVQHAELLYNRAFENCGSMQIISDTAEKMFAKFPHLKELDEDGIAELFYARMRANKQSNCEELCAAAAVVEIAIIETAWVYAMVGCAGALLGYPVCAGVATGIKMLALTHTGITLASCLGNCSDDGIARISSHVRRR